MPADVTEMHGVPRDWKRSDFCRKGTARRAVSDLVAAALARSEYVLLSYSDDGHVTRAEMDAVLAGYDVETLERDHKRYANHTTRAAKARKTTTELLFVIRKRA
jgi:adenine-specific DNA-methyltransferase